MTTAYWIMDSYGTHSGGASIPYITSTRLGWTPTVDAVEGTVYAGTGGFEERTAAAVAAAPDVAVIVGSINDRWTDGVTLLASVTNALSILTASIGTVYAVICCSYGNATYDAASLADTAAVQGAGAARARIVPFINGLSWITAANADTYSDVDGVHPNTAGAAYVGTRLAFVISPPATGLDF